MSLFLLNWCNTNPYILFHIYRFPASRPYWKDIRSGLHCERPILRQVEKGVDVFIPIETVVSFFSALRYAVLRIFIRSMGVFEPRNFKYLAIEQSTSLLFVKLEKRCFEERVLYRLRCEELMSVVDSAPAITARTDVTRDINPHKLNKMCIGSTNVVAATRSNVHYGYKWNSPMPVLEDWVPPCFSDHSVTRDGLHHRYVAVMHILRPAFHLGI